MALHKNRSGPTGTVFNFDKREVTVGLQTTLVVEWDTSGSARSTTTAKKMPKSLNAFMRSMNKVFGDQGFRVRPFADGPEVTAVDRLDVRASGGPPPKQNPRLKGGGGQDHSNWNAPLNQHL
jgi:hypothetical protein